MKPRFCIDWDGTLVEDDKYPGMGDWLPGAAEAVRALCRVGNVVIYSCRVARWETDEMSLRPAGAVDEEVRRIRAKLDEEGLGDLEIWTRDYKPPAAVYIDNRGINFDGDWDATLERVFDLIAPISVRAEEGVFWAGDVVYDTKAGERLTVTVIDQDSGDETRHLDSMTIKSWEDSRGPEAHSVRVGLQPGARVRIYENVPYLVSGMKGTIMSAAPEPYDWIVRMDDFFDMFFHSEELELIDEHPNDELSPWDGYKLAPISFLEILERAREKDELRINWLAPSEEEIEAAFDIDPVEHGVLVTDTHKASEWYVDPIFGEEPWPVEQAADQKGCCLEGCAFPDWCQLPQRHPSSQRFHEILRELGELHDLKSVGYGTDVDPLANVRGSEDWGMPAWVGSMVRAGDKIKRLQAYAHKGDLPFEAIEDAFKDLAVYAVIGLVLFEQGRGS